MPTTDMRDLATPVSERVQPAPRWTVPAELTDGTTRSVVWQWLLTRAALFSLLVVVEGTMTGDVAYYARSLQSLLHGGGIRATLQEYPIPVLGIMLPQYLVGAMNQTAFTILFAVSMLAVDALFTRMLWRAAGRRMSRAVSFWIWFVAVLGPIAYFRFDIVPAALAGVALLAAVRRPAWTGALTAVGAALKLWPALMLPIFLVRRQHRGVILLSFAATALGLALVSLVVGGVDRSLSPLHWQSGRGLQVESVIAAPVMIARMLNPYGSWRTSLSAYKAYEVTGPFVSGLVTLSAIATILGVAVLAVLWIRAVRLPNTTIEIVGWLLVATAAVMTVTNKVLSPQYMLWLAGPLAAVAALDRTDSAPSWHAPAASQRANAGQSPTVDDARPLRRALWLLIVIALLTHLDYPLLYNFLVRNYGPVPLATLVLEARNALLVLFAAYTCREVWRRTVRRDAIAGAAA
jgi:Glycosyltransferase family 87